jgi:hypothetical protein
MKNLEIRNKFHLFVRWGLGIHGIIHLTEFVLNIVEKAWASAFFTLLAAFLMLSGALIDYQHHSGTDDEK